MIGTSHAASGLMVGALTCPFVPVSGTLEEQVAARLAWVAACGGAAVINDLDTGGLSAKDLNLRPYGSRVSLTWGPVTAVLAKGVAKVSRGHRNGTHDPVLGPLAFGLIAFAASWWFWSSLVVLALIIGVTCRACHFLIPGRIEETWIANMVLSFAASWLLLTQSAGAPTWLSAAVALGALVHIAGDWVTTNGVPKPFRGFRAKRQRTTLNLFKTGARIERWLLAPSFLVVAVVVLYLNVGPLLTTALNMPQPPTVTLNLPNWDTPDFTKMLDNLERHIKQ